MKRFTGVATPCGKCVLPFAKTKFLRLVGFVVAMRQHGPAAWEADFVSKIDCTTPTFENLIRALRNNSIDSSSLLSGADSTNTDWAFLPCQCVGNREDRPESSRLPSEPKFPLPAVPEPQGEPGRRESVRPSILLQRFPAAGLRVRGPRVERC